MECLINNRSLKNEVPDKNIGNWKEEDESRLNVCKQLSSISACRNHLIMVPAYLCSLCYWWKVEEYLMCHVFAFCMYKKRSPYTPLELGVGEGGTGVTESVCLCVFVSVVLWWYALTSHITVWLTLLLQKKPSRRASTQLPWCASQRWVCWRSCHCALASMPAVPSQKPSVPSAASCTALWRLAATMASVSPGFLCFCGSEGRK